MPEAQETETPRLEHPTLRDTGNGPNVSYEEDLLREYFGDPDDNGVYGAVSEDAA